MGWDPPTQRMGKARLLHFREDVFQQERNHMEHAYTAG